MMAQLLEAQEKTMKRSYYAAYCDTIIMKFMMYMG